MCAAQHGSILAATKALGVEKPALSAVGAKVQIDLFALEAELPTIIELVPGIREVTPSEKDEPARRQFGLVYGRNGWGLTVTKLRLLCRPILSPGQAPTAITEQDQQKSRQTAPPLSSLCTNTQKNSAPPVSGAL